VIRRVLVCLAVLIFLATPSLAANGGGKEGGKGSSKGSSAKGSTKGSGSGGKTVHVKGYTKKDGTYVAPHDRSAPGTKASTGQPTTSTMPKATSSTATRDAHGRIIRSEAAKHQFEAQTGYPHGRPGYFVDHRIPLACGGADAPSNMQWQTIAEAKAKDKAERAGCRR
jgi:hypothetical protein